MYAIVVLERVCFTGKIAGFAGMIEDFDDEKEESCAPSLLLI